MQPPAPAPIIDVRNISHTFFDGYKAIDDLSFTVQPGEFILIAGRNGSGKTSLIRHLNGLLQPDTGTVFVKGKDVSKFDLHARKTVGMIFQDPDTQIIADTVFDEVAFGLENLKIDRRIINEKVTDILTKMNLVHLEDKNPCFLSGGEKRKLAIGGVLVMAPEVIVFDEPFSNLDYPAICQVRATIIDLNQAGHTIIIAAHDVETVIDKADRMIIMENGRIQRDAPPKQVVKELESFGVREPASSRLGLGIMPWTD